MFTLFVSMLYVSHVFLEIGYFDHKLCICINYHFHLEIAENCEGKRRMTKKNQYDKKAEHSRSQPISLQFSENPPHPEMTKTVPQTN